VELTEYLAPLRRWWWLLIAGALCAVLPAYIALRQQPPLYRSSTTLMIGGAINNPNPSSNDIYLGEQLGNAYTVIAQGTKLRKETMANLGLDRLPDYSVQSVPNSPQLLKIGVTDTDPLRAQAVADQLARQLILQSPTGSNSEAQKRQEFVRAQLDDLEVKIKETQGEITAAQQALANMLSAREIADAQTQIGALQNKLATLQANYAGLLSNTSEGATNTLSVIEPANLPEVPTDANTGRTLLVVAALGFVLSAATAYLLSYLDDTVKNPSEVKKELGLTTLGAVPAVDAASNGNELAMLADTHSGAMEAYRVLRTNLQFAAVGHPLRSLLVTSPAPSEGKSVSTSNLAIALAQSGRRVVAVDADLHRPRLHKLFGLSNSEGLTSALLEESPVLDNLLQATSVPGLRVLTSGPLPPNPSELLESPRMRDLMASLAEQVDMVLLDSPPIVILADATVLSTLADGVLLVLDAGRTRRDVAKRSVETLQGVGAHIAGALLNRVPTRGIGYYYDYYHYYGRSYYGSKNGSGREASGGRSRKKKT
jgi:polysaccharide biosynthesis transport protein